MHYELFTGHPLHGLTKTPIYKVIYYIYCESNTQHLKCSSDTCTDRGLQVKLAPLWTSPMLTLCDLIFVFFFGGWQQEQVIMY